VRFALDLGDIKTLSLSELHHLFDLRINGEDLPFFTFGRFPCVEAVFDFGRLYLSSLPLDTPQASRKCCIIHTTQWMTQSSKGVQSVPVGRQLITYFRKNAITLSGYRRDRRKSLFLVTHCSKSRNHYPFYSQQEPHSDGHQRRAKSNCDTESL